MAGIGLVLLGISYAIMYYGIEAIQGNQQKSFASYVLPFVKQ